MLIKKALVVTYEPNLAVAYRARWDAVVELGRMPCCAASIDCLAKVIRMEKDGETGKVAANSLGSFSDPNATRQLLALTADTDAKVSYLAIKALGHPWHSDAASRLGAMATETLRKGQFPFATIESLEAMGEAGLPQLDALAPEILAGGLKAVERGDVGRFKVAGHFLACLNARSGPGAHAARAALARAMTSSYQSVALANGDYDDVTHALEELKRFDLPESRAALETFSRMPSRRLTRTIFYDADFPDYRQLSRTETMFSSVLGQPPGPEELAEAQARIRSKEKLEEEYVRKKNQMAAEELARKQLESARKEREERQARVFGDLLALGTSEDIAEYARSCLENPGGTKGFSQLQSYLAQADRDTKASELRRVIDQGDKGKLEEYLLRRGFENDVALLEMLRTEDLWDRLLKHEKEYWKQEQVCSARWATEPLFKRFPEAMAQIPMTKILIDGIHVCPSLSAFEALAKLGNVAVFSQPILADCRWPVRRRFYADLIAAKTGASDSALRAFLATETDYELRTLLEENLPPALPAPPATPTPPAAPARPDSPKKEPGVPVVPTDSKELWRRVLAALARGRVAVPDKGTPAEIARTADTQLGSDLVSRFVFEFYYPALYEGETTARFEMAFEIVKQIEGGNLSWKGS